MTIPVRRMALVAVLTLAAVSRAIGGGDDYDAMNDTEGKGPVYFGFVRDHRGAPVPDVKVTLIPKVGEPVVLKSNVLGLYRSHVTKDVVPDDVQLSCEKPGYKPAGILRRNPPGAKDMNIETNCTLQRL